MSLALGGGFPLRIVFGGVSYRIRILIMYNVSCIYPGGYGRILSVSSSVVSCW